MLERAFEAEKKVTISTIEHQLDPPFYTVNTLRYLSKRYPERSFRLCIGVDSLADFDTLHNWKKILNYAPLLVASRASYQIENPAPEIVDQMQFVDHHPVEISSTEIRDRLKNEKATRDLVYSDIEKIINNYYYYRCWKRCKVIINKFYGRQSICIDTAASQILFQRFVISDQGLAAYPRRYDWIDKLGQF